MSYAVYQTVELLWLLIAAVAFVWLMLKAPAPYGRHVRPGFGPQINNRLGWVLMEAPVMLFLWLFYRIANYTMPPGGFVALFMALFMLHYLHRSFVFPLLMRTGNKKMPVAIAVSALGFNLMNGFGLGYYFGKFAVYEPDWLYDWRFIGGLLLFFAGMAVNITSDYRLINLRKPGETGYKIPSGGLFNYICCPNLLGELVEWAGFALMTWCLPALVFWLWSLANLVPRARAHHQWYRNQFTHYPPGRKILLPGLW
ncbi:DUF1295 domain-containing protein [Sphingobacteriales bacterium UPWRP_1]|nr:hypothetical protein BVG80_05620 [Sphingobacteriales bacterium TSM_CSM]PSJ77978.1 DUF1295 domain-containing protein [Sphingobacteriales bacterium UPWRP_1]